MFLALFYIIMKPYKITRHVIKSDIQREEIIGDSAFSWKHQIAALLWASGVLFCEKLH